MVDCRIVSKTGQYSEAFLTELCQFLSIDVDSTYEGLDLLLEHINYYWIYDWLIIYLWNYRLFVLDPPFVNTC